MPVDIYNDETNEKLDFICADDWELPKQVYALELWLNENCKKLKPSQYIADIGYSVRSDASGGGAVVTTRAMKQMVSIGMELYLSEYGKVEK